MTEIRVPAKLVKIEDIKGLIYKDYSAPCVLEAMADRDLLGKETMVLLSRTFFIPLGMAKYFVEPGESKEGLPTLILGRLVLP